MPQNHRKPLDLLETSDLVPVRPESGSYSFVSPRRARKLAAIPAAATAHLEFEDDVPTRDILPLEARGTPPSASLQEAFERLLDEHAGLVPDEEVRTTREFAAPVRAYRDPDLCSCDRMHAALASKMVTVIVAGPVTLSPTSYRDTPLRPGEEDDYDGKPWAFRHCPFEGCLIDAHVAVVGQRDNMTCCGTMALAVERGRVQLSNPERFDQTMAKFTDPGRASVLFSYCPWCATEMLDLSIARHKRHRGL